MANNINATGNVATLANSSSTQLPTNCCVLCVNFDKSNTIVVKCRHVNMRYYDILNNLPKHDVNP